MPIEFDPVLVHQWLERSASRYHQKTALVCGQTRLSYKQVYDQAIAVGAGLLDLGLGRGQRVAILVGNRPQSVMAMYGIMQAGGVFVMISDQVKGLRLAHILDDAQVSILISHASRAPVVKQAFDQVRHRPQLVWVGAGGVRPPYAKGILWEELISLKGITGQVPWPRCIDIDLAALIYTSSSNGRPKGIMCTHRNMISAARSLIQYIQNEPDDVILNVLPLSFDYGLYQVIMAFMFGGTVVLERSFVYPRQVLSRIKAEAVTGLPVIPTIVAMLFRLHDLYRYDFTSLRYITTAGALPAEHIATLRQLIPHARIYSMYELPECKAVCCLDPSQIGSRPGSVGKTLPHCEAYVVDEQCRPVGPGQVGRLMVRGSNVTQGYWQDEKLTCGTYVQGEYPEDRRLVTGDLFKVDEDGFFYFVGREDEIIISRAQRVSTRELEDTLLRMDGICEVAVIGVPDQILGQTIKAFVVPAQGHSITVDQVIRFARSHLEPSMIPKYIEVVADLPRGPNGKVDKHRLATAYQAIK